MDKTKLILGTMTFGPQVDTEGSRAMVKRFFEAGYHEVDTAYVYNEGKTERILGSILMDAADDSLCLATKVHPRITGRLDGAAVAMQLDESLRRLGRDAVDILYLHFPDPNTPVEEPLKACAALHRRGRIKEFGLSNFPAWMVVDIWYLCKDRGWPRPTVCQGLYNALSRRIESELFPASRRLGMRFYAYNPLAGGLLSGKHTSYEDSPPPGRFALRQSYRDRYWKRSYFEAVTTLTRECREAGIDPAEAALRWLAHHSLLDPEQGDGIVIGASKMSQLEQNLSAVQQGRLPQAVVSALDAAWERTKADSPDYFRYYPA